MFKIQNNPTFKTKAQISVPGQTRPAEIEVEFKYLTRKALKAYFDGISGKTDEEALGEIIVGWSGVDTDYSPEALAELLDNYPAAAGDLFEAFRREVLEAKRKN
jgi:hypothetical protein